jgi:two-component system, LytTR family, sensor kinase
VPVQVVIGLAFALLAAPLLELSGQLLGGEHAMAMAHEHATSSWLAMLRKDSAGWIASATTFILAYGFALALITGFALYRRFRDSELRLEALERAWSGARLAALRLQLSPHTLFNLLHTIRGQIGWDPGTAQSMIVQLGDLLRRLLVAGERDFTRLADELQFVELYLSLQQKRFADRLTVSLPQTPLPNTWVPSLILQPLVENAVSHGLGGHSGPVTVRVEAQASGNGLILRVINTVAPDHASDGAGIGLRNVRERLAVQFGDRAQFNAGRDSSGDWIAEIHMPLLKEPDTARERGRALR